jgi:cytochrome c-type biogenesis protein CcmH
MRLALVTLLCLVFACANAEEPLPDKDLEVRANELFNIVKCPVCEGQSIKDSGADLAVAMREHIRTEIAKGRNNDEIMANLKSAYGSEISFMPEFSPSNFFALAAPTLAYSLSA